MNPEYDIYEQIDQYLSNAMSQDELTLFSSNLAKDQSLQELVEAQKLANEIIIDNEMIRLKERMQMDLGNGGNSGGGNHVKIILSAILIISASVGSYVYFSADRPSNKVQMSNSLNESLNIKKNIETGNLQEKRSDKVTRISTPKIREQRSEDTSKIVVLNPSIARAEEQEKHALNDPVYTTELITTDNKGTAAVENKKINCDEVKIKANTKVDFGFSTSEGIIIIDKKTIQGGEGPYLFSLDKETYTVLSKFENVKEGIYSVYIKDRNNCICILQQPVVVKPQVEHKEIDEAFNPTYGDKWPFPLGNNMDGAITIYNKGGSVVFSAKINGGYPSEWDGRDIDGNELGTGNYYFIINFTNNAMVKGHITIAR